jgi:hypothetical protein
VCYDNGIFLVKRVYKLWDSRAAVNIYGFEGKFDRTGYDRLISEGAFW